MTPPPDPTCTPDRCPYADELVDRIAGEVARRAAREFFAQLGINAEHPREVEEFRRDLQVLQDLRRARDRATGAAVTLIVGALFAALWIGIQSMMTGGQKP